MERHRKDAACNEAVVARVAFAPARAEIHPAYAIQRCSGSGNGLGEIVSSMPSSLAVDVDSGMPVGAVAELGAEGHWPWPVIHRSVQHHGKFVAIVDPRGYAF